MKIKEIIIYTVLLLSSLLLCYLFVSFVQLDLNPFNWSKNLRGFMVSISCLVYACFVILNEINKQ